MPAHVHSFGPRGRAICACGLAPEDLQRVRDAADDVGDILLPLTGAERREVLREIESRGLLTVPVSAVRPRRAR